jgi:hypothetical protein
MSIFSVTAVDIVQKYLVKTPSVIPYGRRSTKREDKFVPMPEGGENLWRFVENIYTPVDSIQVV